MTDYVLTTYTTQGDFETVIAALETKLETVVNTKTIRKIEVTVTGNTWYGYLIYDT